MDISTDLAAVQSRIAEITGVPVQPAAAPPAVSAPGAAAPNSFASMVRSALRGSALPSGGDRTLVVVGADEP